MSAPPPPHDGRTNEQWLAGLRRDDTEGVRIQADLRAYVRGGLGRVFGRQGDVDDATLDDFTQDAMIRILTRLDDFRGDSRLTTWAMAIAIRVAYTALRRRRWGERSLDDLGLVTGGEIAAAETPGCDPAAPADRGDLLAALRDAIDRALTTRQRAAVLGELAGMPTTVLAEQLGTNSNALYKLCHDARRRLGGALSERGFPEAEVRNILEGASNA